MRIGIDASCLGVESARTRGIGQYTRCLIKDLLRIDQTNQYVIFYGDKVPPLWEGSNVENRIKKEPSTFSSALRHLYQQTSFPIELFLAKVDLIHFPSHIRLPFFQARVKSTVTVLDTIPYLFPEAYFSNRSFQGKVVTKCDEYAIKKARAIITISQCAKNDIVKIYGVKPDKVMVIYLGVEEIFRPLEKNHAFQKVKDEYNIQDKFLLYVGGFDARKNLLALLDIFYNLKTNIKLPHKLVIVGNISLQDQDFVKVFKKVVSLNLCSDVIFTDFVPDEDLSLFYNAADIFVFPSVYEGFGLPILEAMACGTPVVALNVSSIPEIAGGAAKLIEIHENEKFGDAIVEVLSNRDIQQELREKGIIQARKFSWKKTAEKTLEVYQSVYEL